METNEIIKLIICAVFIFIDFYLVFNVIQIRKVQKYGTTMYDKIYHNGVIIKNRCILRISLASCINIGLVIWFFML